jgi:hypothetical protein
MNNYTEEYKGYTIITYAVDDEDILLVCGENSIPYTYYLKKGDMTIEDDNGYDTDLDKLLITAREDVDERVFRNGKSMLEYRETHRGYLIVIYQVHPEDVLKELGTNEEMFTYYLMKDSCPLNSNDNWYSSRTKALEEAFVDVDERCFVNPEEDEIPEFTQLMHMLEKINVRIDEIDTTLKEVLK